MKIILITVVPPYRGGISAHSSILYKQLIKSNNDVKIIIYSKQYPKFLFPGKEQFNADNTDYDIESNRIIDTTYPVKINSYLHFIL